MAKLKEVVGCGKQVVFQEFLIKVNTKGSVSEGTESGVGNGEQARV